MTPTTPRESRKASNSSPITTIFFGGPSASGNSADSNTGIQNRRSNSPIPVPAPLSVRNLLSSARSIECPPSCYCFWHSLAQAERGVNAGESHFDRHPEEAATRPSRRTTARVSHPSRLVEPVIGPAGGRTRWLAPPAITAKPLRGDDDGECGAIEFIRRNSAISPRIAELRLINSIAP